MQTFSIFGNVDQTPELKNVTPALSLFFHLFDVFGRFILIWKDSFFQNCTPTRLGKSLSRKNIQKKFIFYFKC